MHHQLMRSLLLKCINKLINKVAINGTTFSVTEAILLIPPIIIIPTNIARTTPIIAPAAVLSNPNNSFKTTVA